MVTKHPVEEPLEPYTVREALKQDNWRNAMADEFNALVANGTWELVAPTAK